MHFNDGSGAFTDSGQALGNDTTQGIALGDLDGDGDLDAVAVNDGDPNTVWINRAGTGMVISEIRPEGPGGAADEFVELYNGGSVGVDLGGWILWIESGLGIDYYTFPSVTIPPGAHYLVANAASPVAGSADGTWTAISYGDWGDVLLEDFGGAVVDTFGYGTVGNPIFYESNPAPTWTLGGADRSYERLPGGASGNCTDTDDNLADWFFTAVANPQSTTDPAVSCP